MPCEEIIQVVGTLIPLESRTLLSNQLAQGGSLQIDPKATFFKKRAFSFKESLNQYKHTSWWLRKQYTARRKSDCFFEELRLSLR
ncbi:hypothetical protein ACTWQL_21395 [Pseudalkalibacillus sp. R45]|uniref:hypothetical protein n=1 Tax=Pseudalkalibacillus sp. R45 TaxID=3457433 RepID=UPI003FCC5385